jgi:hypothetical protein
MHVVRLFNVCTKIERSEGMNVFCGQFGLLNDNAYYTLVILTRLTHLTEKTVECARRRLYL